MCLIQYFQLYLFSSVSYKLSKELLALFSKLHKNKPLYNQPSSSVLKLSETETHTKLLMKHSEKLCWYSIKHYWLQLDVHITVTQTQTMTHMTESWTGNQPPLWTQMTFKKQTIPPKKDSYEIDSKDQIGTNPITNYERTKQVIIGIDALSHSPKLHKKFSRNWITMAYANIKGCIRHTHLRNPII